MSGSSTLKNKAKEVSKDCVNSLLEFIQTLPDIARSHNLNMESVSGSVDVTEKKGNNDLKCVTLPLVLTPLYLSAVLLTGGFFPLAAQIYWSTVLRRPSALFTSEAACALLFSHISTSALPFYLSSSDSLIEVVERSWGWNHWNALCQRALR